MIVQLDNKNNEPVIRVEKLCKLYGNARALQAIDLTFAGGGVSAILGANGAGKSTFIKCLLGLVPVTNGTLSLFGKPAGHLQARQRIGVMLQDTHLPDHLTAREHIALFASYYPNPEPVEKLIKLCDLTGFENKLYHKLSGGQKRRVQFAIALVGQPDLIFLDEPTTGLDTVARQRLWAAVRTLAASGKTIILTTHYLEEADTLADRIIVLKDGCVVADAPTGEIRNGFNTSQIQCITSLSDYELQQIPAVCSVTRAGRFRVLQSKNAADSLRALLAQDQDILDITVKSATLEEALANLTHGNAEEHGEPASLPLAVNE